MIRICPVCHLPLKQLSLKNRLQVDCCQSCKGLWFDKNELTLAQQQQHELSKQFWGKQTVTRDKVQCELCKTYNPRSEALCKECGNPLRFLCPSCRLQMEEVLIQDVFVDRCQRCQGVWLDGGELELLFKTFTQKQRAEFTQTHHHDRGFGSDLATWIAIDAVDDLIWHPGLLYNAGEAAVEGIAELPGAVAAGVGAAIDHVGDIPELAGSAVDFAGSAVSGAIDFAGNIPELASGAADLAGSAVSGAMSLAGEIPELASSAAEAGASFVGMLFDLISSIFDD